MPLMMDDEMDIDVDDLFGDGGALSLATRPPSKELYQRIDEIRGSGCCQTIAWSKWGSIASVTSNGATLELRNLRCNPENGNWDLSNPTVTPPLMQNADGGPLKHLSWSPTGHELAVIDSAGRVIILGLFASLNKPSLARHGQIDPADDLHRVVGCYWLNTAPFPPNRPTMMHGPAIKEGSNFRYESSQAPVLGPCHPNHQKSAFVCVTTNGMLRVLWPQNNQKWYESHTELESIVSSEDLITHAAITSDKNGTLLIAFATTSKQLRTVRAVIDWGIPKPIPEKVNPASLALNPTVKTRHLAVTSWLHDIGDTLNSSNLESSMVQLSHLEFLPPFVDSTGRMVPATIVAIRSHLPVPISNYNQDVHTTVDRWEVRERPQTIHPAFEQLSSRRNSVGSQPPPVSYLNKLEGFTVNKIAISIQSMNLGRVVCFAYSDSSVEYRDRVTMAEAFVDGDLDRVWHLAQIGFSYADDEPCLQSTFSPTFCSVVQIRNDRKVKWKRLDYHLGEIGSSMEDSRYAAVVAALTCSCASAVMTNVNYDDLVATVHKHLKINFSYDWLVELSRILKVHVDYSEESHYDVLIRNTTIQLCLSIQNSLGFQGDFRPRTFSGKFSWIVLHLRNLVVVVTMAANMKVKGQNNEPSSPLEDPEMINALAGSVRWVLDLVAWITDTLLTLPSTLPENMDLKDPTTISLPDLLTHLKQANNISLHLLLSSPTRGFLTAICRRLAHIDYIARKAITMTPHPQNGPSGQPQPQPVQNLSPALKAAYLQIAILTDSTILRIKTFETLLSSLSSHIKTAYASHNPSLSGSQQAEKTRNAIEIKMMLGGSIPDAFKSVIAELFRPEGLLDSVREEIDPSKLFFADFSLLEVDEDPVSVGKRKRAGMTMDCFRKSWLPNPNKKDRLPPGMPIPPDTALVTGGLAGGGRQGARWKRCARCTAVMEDVLTQKQALQWLVMQQRRCFCGGYWDTLGPGETMA